MTPDRVASLIRGVRTSVTVADAGREALAEALIIMRTPLIH